MNLFTGMSRNEIISAVLAFVLFNGFVVVEVIALAAFYVTSRPRAGRVRTAAMWHLTAVVFGMLALITTVWAAPAQKSFLDDATVSVLFPFGQGDLSWRFAKVLIGIAFAVAAIVCITIGILQGRAQKRLWQEEALQQA